MLGVYYNGLSRFGEIIHRRRNDYCKDVLTMHVGVIVLG
jgi:hypothetical protein